MRFRFQDYLPPLGLLLALFALWELVAWRLNLSYILPAPSAIFLRMGSDWPLLLRHALVTLEEVLLGLAIAFLLGLGMAMLIFHSRSSSGHSIP
jgi:ABC-type nitrate/sulfonate/bicarbonate transport system permease component